MPFKFIFIKIMELWVGLERVFNIMKMIDSPGNCFDWINSCFNSPRFGSSNGSIGLRKLFCLYEKIPRGSTIRHDPKCTLQKLMDLLLAYDQLLSVLVDKMQ